MVATRYFQIIRKASILSRLELVQRSQPLLRCHYKIQFAYNTNKTLDDNDNSDWIPPTHPLAGDRGQSYLDGRFNETDTELELQEIEKQLKELEEQEKTISSVTVPVTGVDWLQTRRTKLGGEPIEMLSPEEAKVRKNSMADIPVKHHTLLSKDEIASCLEVMGGRDITVILDDFNNRRMGGALGLIIVSAATHTQLSMMADALVRQMRRRDLHQLDVFGAKYGPEGNTRTSSQVEETWIVVDCRNYVVHFQDTTTRKLVNLEALWSGEDPLFQIDYRNEDEVDDYVANYPVPEKYGRSTVDFDNVLKQLHKSRYTSPHKPVMGRNNNNKKKKRVSTRRR